MENSELEIHNFLKIKKKVILKPQSHGKKGKKQLSSTQRMIKMKVSQKLQIETH
jgi:hypothetical protein